MNYDEKEEPWQMKPGATMRNKKLQKVDETQPGSAIYQHGEIGNEKEVAKAMGYTVETKSKPKKAKKNGMLAVTHIEYLGLSHVPRAPWPMARARVTLSDGSKFEVEKLELVNKDYHFNETRYKNGVNPKTQKMFDLNWEKDYLVWQQQQQKVKESLTAKEESMYDTGSQKFADEAKERDAAKAKRAADHKEGKVVMPAKERKAEAKPKVKRESNGAKDRFGFRVGTQAADIGAAVNTKAQTVEDIAKKCKLGIPRVKNHLGTLLRMGHVVKSKDNKFTEKKV